MDESTRTRISSLVERMVADFEGKRGNARAMAAHRPIYDQAYAQAMNTWNEPKPTFDHLPQHQENALTDTPHPIAGFYRHYKGQRYEVIGTAQHSETREWVVVYRALYGEMGLWVRPLAMFTETVEVDGQTVARFRPE